MNPRKLQIKAGTAALPYANGPVHIGHLAGVYIPADVYARFQRRLGSDVAFICGSDEHGIPITIRAKKEGVAMVDEGIRSEFIAIVNYGIIGLVQLELGYAETDDMTEERALELYDRYAKQALELMLAKNHDYDEAWRSMRVSSYTDLILMKIYRTKQIEGHDGATLVSEGIDANYMDMINYSVFGLIKLEFGE
jgi:leucyl-tRNA synthetase